MRDKLRSSLQKDSPQRKRGIWHSKAYHRFFEGYSEFTVPTPNGKGYKIQRVYTGNTYRQDLTKGQRGLLRVLYVVLFVCAVYLFVSCAVLPLPSNSTWYVTLPQAVSLPFLFWIANCFLVLHTRWSGHDYPWISQFIPSTAESDLGNRYLPGCYSFSHANLHHVKSIGRAPESTALHFEFFCWRVDHPGNVLD